MIVGATRRVASIKGKFMNSPDNAIRMYEQVDMGLDPVKAFPFIYTLVPPERDNWERDHASSAYGNVCDLGPLIGAGATVMIPIEMSPDMAFKLLWIKYSVLELPRIQRAGYHWYLTPPGGGNFSAGDFQMGIGTPLTRFLHVKLSVDHDQRVLHGTMNLEGWRNQAQYTPLDISCSQGYDYGYGQLRTPYLLPRSSALIVEITNTADVALVPAAAIYGMKVRI